MFNFLIHVQQLFHSSLTAERATGTLVPGTGGLSSAGLGPLALLGPLLHTAGFLPAPPVRTCQHSWWLPNPLCSLSGTVGPHLPQVQTPTMASTSLAPQHRQRWEEGTILTFACRSSSLSRLPALSVLHWARGEGQKVSSAAAAAGLEVSAQGQSPGRGALTVRRRLSSLVDGNRVTQAPLGPSGVLAPGRDRRELGEPQAASSLLSSTSPQLGS